MIRTSTLPSGLRILTESMPHVRSATIGVWCDVGSAAEPAERRGLSHLLEHMAFKGTPTRSARVLAETMDAVGGELNAATDKETTVFYAHLVDRRLPLAVDVLGDMLQNALIAADDLAKEKNVVLEEIKMYDDSPDEVVGDKFAKTLWRGANLGDPTIGYAATVSAMSREDVLGWRAARYGPKTVIVTAAGNLDHDTVVRLVAEAFGAFRGDATPQQTEAPLFTPDVDVTVDDTEQAYIMMGTPGLGMRDERRYALSVLDTLLGGGPSSRLFQSAREERALCYEISTFQQNYRDAGIFGVSAGCAAPRAQELLDVVADELDRVLQDGVNAAEVERAREHLKGNLTLALESTFNRMSRLARNEIVHGRQISAEEIEAQFDAVDKAAVDRLARELLGTRGLCMLGPAELAGVRLRGAAAA
jgi:predicted Zn-dependent peptidase